MRQKAEAIKKKIKKFKKKAGTLYLDFSLGFVFVVLFLLFMFASEPVCLSPSFFCVKGAQSC